MGAIPNAFEVNMVQLVEVNAACFHLVQKFLFVKAANDLRIGQSNALLEADAFQ